MEAPVLMRLRHQQTGFTLIEVIVVMVLIGLITTLLIQGLSFSMSLRAQGLRLSAEKTEARLREHWFRTLINGAAPDHREGPNLFQGTATKLNGLTLNPLHPGAAPPAPFTLEIENRQNDTLLHYSDGAETHWPLFRLENTAWTFQYLAPDSTWKDQWPPEPEASQLPQAIRLTTNREDAAVRWVQSIPQRKDPRPDSKELLGI